MSANRGSARESKQALGKAIWIGPTLLIFQGPWPVITAALATSLPTPRLTSSFHLRRHHCLQSRQRRRRRIHESGSASTSFNRFATCLLSTIRRYFGTQTT